MIQCSPVLERSAAPVRVARIKPGITHAGRQKEKYRIKALAEAVILQSIEDIFDSLQKKKSINFFKGEDFRLCAEIAGLSSVDQIRLIGMLANAGFKQSVSVVINYD